jgi:hypothetical protein
MLLVFSSLITIGNLKLDFFTEIDIKSSWKQMTDTALIKIPKKVWVKGGDLKNQKISDVIKTGDRVVIQMGYDGNLTTEFIGYVGRSPKPSVPIEIQCEDEMWRMKRKTIDQKVFANGKVKDLIDYIIPEYAADAQIFDSELGTNYSCISSDKGTVAQALKQLEDVFGLKSFFRLVPDASQPYGVKQVLCVGRPYSSGDLAITKPVTYRLRDNTKSDTLEYQFAADRQVQIRGKAKVDNGKDLTFNYPPEFIEGDGDTVTVDYFGVSQAELEQQVKADYLKLKADRYKGDVTGYGIPYTRHGMTVNVIDDYYEKRGNVLFFIDQVEQKVSASLGWQRINTLGYQVTEQTRQTFK